MNLQITKSISQVQKMIGMLNLILRCSNIMRSTKTLFTNQFFEKHNILWSRGRTINKRHHEFKSTEMGFWRRA